MGPILKLENMILDKSPAVHKVIEDSVEWNVFSRKLLKEYNALYKYIELNDIDRAKLCGHVMLKIVLTEVNVQSKNLKKVDINYIRAEIGRIVERIAWHKRRLDEEKELKGINRHEPWQLLEIHDSLSDEEVHINMDKYCCKNKTVTRTKKPVTLGFNWGPDNGYDHPSQIKSTDLLYIKDIKDPDTTRAYLIDKFRSLEEFEEPEEVSYLSSISTTIKDTLISGFSGNRRTNNACC